MSNFKQISKKTLIVSLVLLSFSLLQSCSKESQTTDKVILKITHFLPASSNAQQNVLKPWCKQLTEESAGRIKCQFYPSNQLGGTPATLVDLVRNGVADIVWTAPSYSPGKFLRIEALELPFMLPYGGELGNKVIWQYYQDYAKDEFKDFKVLAMLGDGGMDIHVRGKPIQKLDDFKGLKLRASSRMAANIIEAFGATPVSMPPAQMTESISKGVVDGAMASWEVVPPTKLDEVTKYHSAIPQGTPAMAYTVLTTLMNQKKYDSLPDDLKQIIDKNSGIALVQRFGEQWDIFSANAIKESAEGSIQPISKQDYEDMRQSTAKIEQKWIDSAKAIDGQKLVDGLKRISKQFGTAL